jgi:hypothetical protein
MFFVLVGDREDTLFAPLGAPSPAFLLAPVESFRYSDHAISPNLNQATRISPVESIYTVRGAGQTFSPTFILSAMFRFVHPSFGSDIRIGVQTVPN